MSIVCRFRFHKVSPKKYLPAVSQRSISALFRPTYFCVGGAFAACLVYSRETMITGVRSAQERRVADRELEESPVHLTPKDEDRLLLFLAAELARRHRDKGLKLSYPEARALIADEVVEAARAGATVAEAAQLGAHLLTEDDLLPGVASLVGTVQVEGFFNDGQKLVTIHDPIRPGTAPAAGDEPQVTPGEILVDDGEIELNSDRKTTEVTVTNSGDRPVQVGSHFHFFEVNRALEFDRRAAYGMHLDIASGTAVRFEPGEERAVQLTAFGGTRELYGLNDMTNEALGEHPSQDLLDALDHAGFRRTPASS